MQRLNTSKPNKVLEGVMLSDKTANLLPTFFFLHQEYITKSMGIDFDMHAAQAPIASREKKKRVSIYQMNLLFFI